MASKTPKQLLNASEYKIKASAAKELTKLVQQLGAIDEIIFFDKDEKIGSPADLYRLKIVDFDTYSKLSPMYRHIAYVTSDHSHVYHHILDQAMSVGVMIDKIRFAFDVK